MARLQTDDDDDPVAPINDRALMERLELHIMNTFRIKLAAMRLSRVSTFAVSVSHDGRIKVRRTIAVAFVSYAESPSSGMPRSFLFLILANS